MPLCPTGQLPMSSPLILDPRSHLPAWMRVSTLKKAASRCSSFQGALDFLVCLYPALATMATKRPLQLETSLGTWSQSGLDGPRGTRKERESSFHFQEAVNPKGMCRNSLATPRDRKIETSSFLQGPLSRLGSWGSPSSDLEKSPRIHCFTQLDPNG